MKKLYAVLGFVVFAVLLVHILNQGNSETSTSKRKIYVTFYPIAVFTQAIGKDALDVITLVPPGSEPHDFEPSSKQIAELQKSGMFIYNGAGFEPWVEKLLPELHSKHVLTVNASSGINLIGMGDGHFDPHFWLDPVSAQKEVDTILAGLSMVDPSHTHEFAANAQDLKEKLSALDITIKNSLQKCSRRDVISSHNAFAYYARRYSLSVIPIAGLSPEDEPSPQRLAEISTFARSKNITYIFFESLVSPRLSDTIAKEIGAKTLVFNPLEGLTQEEIAQGKDYFNVQEENLAHLRIALECE